MFLKKGAQNSRGVFHEWTQGGTWRARRGMKDNNAQLVSVENQKNFMDPD